MELLFKTESVTAAGVTADETPVATGDDDDIGELGSGSEPP